MTESRAIMKHLCRTRKPELLGKSVDVQAKIDMVDNFIYDCLYSGLAIVAYHYTVTLISWYILKCGDVFAKKIWTSFLNLYNSRRTFTKSCWRRKDQESSAISTILSRTINGPQGMTLHMLTSWHMRFCISSQFSIRRASTTFQSCKNTWTDLRNFRPSRNLWRQIHTSKGLALLLGPLTKWNELNFPF